jgi:hypothetical protein
VKSEDTIDVSLFRDDNLIREVFAKNSHNGYDKNPQYKYGCEHGQLHNYP